MCSSGFDHMELNKHLNKQRAGTLQRPTRRHFLRLSAQAGLSASVLCALSSVTAAQDRARTRQPARGYFALPPEAADDPLLKLTRSSFAKFNGDFFETIQDSGEKLLINLLRIEDLPKQRALEMQGRLVGKQLEQLREESFSLIFRGPLEIPLRQRIHRLNHPALGSLELFMVPVGKDEGSRYYEVLFNRTRQ